jgi:mono/diheme cytochrome c family protein
VESCRLDAAARSVEKRANPGIFLALHHSMWRPLGLLPAVIVLLAVVPATLVTGTHVAATQSTQGEAARGDYLVHSVAMCVQCHTPRMHDGTLLMDEQLAGAPMPVKSPYPGRPFAFAAPHIAGLPAGWTEDAFVHFLMTGDAGDRPKPQPPMPPFRMTEADARAVAAYLKTLR